MSKEINEELKIRLEKNYPNRIDQIMDLSHRETFFVYKANYNEKFKKQVEQDDDPIDLRSSFNVTLDYENYGGDKGFNVNIWNDWGYRCQDHFVKTTSILYAVRKGLEGAGLIDDNGKEIILGSRW